jgi:hypothetical protein
MRSIPQTGASAPAAAARRLTYWLDVQPASRGGAVQSTFPSVGDDQFESGSKFRLNLVAPVPGYCYILADNLADSSNPSGLTLLYPLAAVRPDAPAPGPVSQVTTGWYVFSGPPAVERVWLVWAREPVSALAALTPLVNERDFGIVRDTDTARAVRELLAHAAAVPTALTRDPSAISVTIEADSSIIAHRLELQHE